jgi:5-methylcytosine-specific restriction endonuclease McrA
MGVASVDVWIYDRAIIDEIQQLYWESEESTVEIVRAYDLGNLHTLLEFVEPRLVSGVRCKHCAGPVFAGSRAQRDRVLSSKYGNLWCVCARCHDRLERHNKAADALRREARQRRYAELVTMPYRQYLLTPEWQATRQDALKRAGYRCQLCARRSGLQVHHRTYVRRGRETRNDVIVLCGGCHGAFHKASTLAEGGRADT